MSHSFTNLLFHVLFATKGRSPVITQEILSELLPYVGGIVRHAGGKALIVNAVSDHLHMLIRLPADVALADCIRLVKANSSKWVHEKWSESSTFGWQIGYTAFTVSLSQRDRVYKYIRNQAEHHKKRSFIDELTALISRHGGNPIDLIDKHAAPEGADVEQLTVTHS